MSLTEQLIWVAVTAAGLIGSWICSGMETGIYSLNRVTLEVRAGRKQRAATILRNELEHSERLLGTLLISNNIFNYISAMGATALLQGWGYSDWWIVAINAVILTPLLFIFVESIPKELFRQEADHLTYALARVLLAFRILLTAVFLLPMVRWIGRGVARLLGAGSEVTLGTGRDRVAALLKETAGSGILSESQARLVDRALAFTSTTVAAEMIPWSRAATVLAEWDRSRTLRVMMLSQQSSFPVVDRRGQVLGIVGHLELLSEPDQSVASLLAPPLQFSPDLPAREAVLRLAEAGADLALVVQNQRTLGTVTMDDLLEPLTGEVQAL